MLKQKKRRKETELRESILFQDGLLNEIMALIFQTMGKTTFLFNTIDDLSLKKTNGWQMLPN